MTLPIERRPLADKAEARLIIPTSIQHEFGDLMSPDTPPGETAARGPARWTDVPWRTILASIGAVVAAYSLARVVYIAQDLIVLVCIAGFFAIVLTAPVRWAQERLRLRRGAAIALSLFLTLVVVFGMIALFILPVRSQLVAAISDLPGTVEQASRGRGPIGNLAERLNLVSVVRENQQTLTDLAHRLEDALPSMLTRLLSFVLDTVTVVVLTALMLLQSKALNRAGIQLVPIRHRERVATVARDAASAVSGFMIGNLIISVVAGASAFVVLLLLGVPNAAVLAMFVAFADMIPLVGATIGAAVALVAAFVHSPGAGVVALIFFFVYQQFENSVLQVVVMSRRVRVNPLVVLLSILVGVDLFGIVGALLALPVAGAVTVIISAGWRHRPAGADELVVVSDQVESGRLVRRPTRRTALFRWLDRNVVRRHRVLPEEPRQSPTTETNTDTRV